MAENPDRPLDRDPGGTTGPPAASGPAAAPGSAVTGEHSMTRTEPGGDHRAPRVRRSFTAGAGAVRRRATGVLATVVSAVTTVIVLILAVHIVFVAFEANTGNDLVRWFGDRATDLSWQFRDVFQPDDPKVAVAVNYGLAALVYLVAGRVLVGLIRRL